MKKLLIILGGLVVLLIVAVLFGPGLVNWNSYKAEITARAKEATGLDIYIDGDLEMAVLPAPALVVNNVRLSNSDGASVAEMVRLKSLQVRVALGPLLSGQIRVQTIRLVEPVIELERFADGRWNVLELLNGLEDNAAAKEGSPTTALSPDDGAGGGEALDVRLDNFVIENGTLIYRDGAAGSVEKIERINASVAAASLSGPFDSTGSLQLRGFPVSYDVSLGDIIEGRTVPVSFSVQLSPEKGRIQATGAITGLNEVPTFKGTIAGDSDHLTDIVHGLSGAGELPGLLGQAFRFQANVVASDAAVSLSDLKLALGSAELTGSVSAGIAEEITVAVDLATSSINLDDWLALPPVARPASVNSTAQQETNASANSSVSLSMPDKPLATGNSGKIDPFALSDGIGATLAFKADSLTFRGGLVRHARVNLELANGEITVSQLAAQLPGGADVAVFGFLSPFDGEPQFDGQVEAMVSDLRGLMNWIGVAPPSVPTDRLRKLTLAGKLTASPEQVQATEIDLQFDSSRITGAATVNLRKRLSLGLDVLLDRINLDAYMMPTGNAAMAIKSSPVTATDAAGADDLKPQSATGQDKNPLAETLAGLEFLTTFDANIKARVKTLVYGGTPIKNIVFDGTLFDSALELRRLSVDKMAGSSVSLNGKFGNFTGIPSLQGVQLNGKITDLQRLMRLAGSPPPPEAKNIGAITLKTMLDGSLLKPKIDLVLSGAGATVKAAGNLSLLPLVGGFDGNLKVRHKNLVGLLRSFGVDYRPAGDLGGLRLDTNIKADMSGLKLNDLKGQAGTLAVQGDLALAIDGPRPKITTNLTTGEVKVDNLLPASKSAWLNDAGGFIAAAFVAPEVDTPAPAFRRMVVMKPGQWPTDPIDLSALKDFDADVTLKTSAIIYGNYRVENADVVVAVDNGVLRVSRLNGDLFGGTFDAKATVTAARPLQVTTTVTTQNIDVGKALMAITGEKAATGQAEMSADLTTRGDSVAALIATLSGRGNVALRKLDVKSGGKGSAMSAALGLVAGLNNLGGTLLGGKKTKGTTADITGSFDISGGIARTNDMKLVSGMGDGRATGNVDLSRWLIDVAGQVDLSANFVSLILNQGSQSSSGIPFSIKGQLDAPTVKLDTSKLLTGSLPALGIDKLLNKKGVGSLLQNLLPGVGGNTQSTPPPATAQPASPPPPGSSPPPPPSSQPRKVKPQDLLKGLLKGLGG